MTKADDDETADDDFDDDQRGTDEEEGEDWNQVCCFELFGDWACAVGHFDLIPVEKNIIESLKIHTPAAFSNSPVMTNLMMLTLIMASS